MVVAFRASLSHYRLPLIVPALLDRTPLTGTLRLERGALRRSFHFRDGFLEAERSSEPREHLAQVLSQLNILDVASAATAFEAARNASVPLGAFLIEHGFVSRVRLVEALSHKAREAFFDCYTWESGEMEVAPDETPDELGVSLRLPLGELHRDALMRFRDWRAFRLAFPSNNSTLHVHRRSDVDRRSAREQELVSLAEKGATIGELLASVPEGHLAAARLLMQLHHRGLLSVPGEARKPAVGDGPDVPQLIGRARSLLSQGRFEEAAALAQRAIESAPCPEACTLYREAEQRMGAILSDEVEVLEGQIQVLPLRHPLPSTVTAADLYLHSVLGSSPSVRHALSSSPAGELAAFQSLRRLVIAGLVRITGDEARRRQTVPYGLPALRT